MGDRARRCIACALACGLLAGCGAGSGAGATLRLRAAWVRRALTGGEKAAWRLGATLRWRPGGPAEASAPPPRTPERALALQPGVTPVPCGVPRACRLAEAERLAALRRLGLGGPGTP